MLQPAHAGDKAYAANSNVSPTNVYAVHNIAVYLACSVLAAIFCEQLCQGQVFSVWPSPPRTHTPTKVAIGSAVCGTACTETSDPDLGGRANTPSLYPREPITGHDTGVNPHACARAQDRHCEPRHATANPGEHSSPEYKRLLPFVELLHGVPPSGSTEQGICHGRDRDGHALLAAARPSEVQMQ